MSRNESQVSEHTKAEDYLGSTREPERQHREDVIVLDISDTKADGLTHLKLARNGHVRAFSNLCAANVC